MKNLSGRDFWDTRCITITYYMILTGSTRVYQDPPWFIRVYQGSPGSTRVSLYICVSFRLHPQSCILCVYFHPHPHGRSWHTLLNLSIEVKASPPRKKSVFVKKVEMEINTWEDSPSFALSETLLSLI